MVLTERGRHYVTTVHESKLKRYRLNNYVDEIPYLHNPAYRRKELREDSNIDHGETNQ